MKLFRPTSIQGSSILPIFFFVRAIIKVDAPLLLLELRPQKFHSVAVLQRRRLEGAQHDSHGRPTEAKSQLFRRQVVAVADRHRGIAGEQQHGKVLAPLLCHVMQSGVSLSVGMIHGAHGSSLQQKHCGLETAMLGAGDQRSFAPLTQAVHPQARVQQPVHHREAAFAGSHVQQRHGVRVVVAEQTVEPAALQEKQLQHYIHALPS
mmetsp:Transcript_14471/g.19825  ORF Transcript_14471/g.19825 Transcript_14471/m.19825 type:complete len:206 (-) Transcript_14471:1278-1895(-)